MDTTAMLIDVAILTPIIAVVGILAFSKKPNLREAISLIAGVTLLAINLKLYSSFNHGEVLSRQWLEILPGLNLSFRVDALGLLFGLVASLLWPVTTLYAIGYMRGHNEDHQTRFYACFAIAIAAVMAIAYAENLFTLFIFYEVLSLCTYPLVTHAGTEKAKKGGRVYLGILMGTSIAFFLPAIIITWLVAGTLDFQQGGIFPEQTPIALLSLLLVLFVFGVAKAAVMPFHRWLPAAMVAPTPVSALLHAVAVVKAGVFSLIKILVFIFGLDTLQQIPVSDYLLYLAGAGVVLASLIAMRQDNLKARLAYSTISQLGYITVGVLLAVESGVMGSAMHIATHALGKITLFFCAGAILVASHKSEISSMVGLGRSMPITMTAFFIASLSIIGLPPTAGTWSKWWLLTATLETDHLILMGVLILSSLLNIAYLLPIPLRAFFPGKQAVSGPVAIHEAPPAALIALCSTALACVLLFFFPNPLFELVSQIFSEGTP
ncbi:proton-conducting transporter membrane subunit [uncultured Zhongshania sp.]|jgi:multicomponent Na+:H+ antiporter subunit D|uniref:proton-conducting transporter transmembrane domain-containing protein n=1 Tax=uncultured Zhongshania sp. TaxID=1642288 RepID=UPI0025FDA729|nr:proton-conducting transporter membrane subunit [uncultured Zhongshania sp.]|tara:strand:- start:2418 stop:3893 length:1476 start_codon:yes stop_codon:yes gene_type:complete